MVYKVLVTKEIDETLNNIDLYCIQHFNNYDYAQKVLNEILYVASFLSENAGNHHYILNTYISILHQKFPLIIIILLMKLKELSIWKRCYLLNKNNKS